MPAPMPNRRSALSAPGPRYVETFQPAYLHTQPMGALATQLISADNNGHWGSWALLAASNSNVRTDNVGFH